MRVTVENFQKLGKVALEVEGLTVLVGPSNRGKSALVRAIESALFGRPGEEFIREGAKLASVVLQHAPSANGTGTADVTWTKGKGKTTFTLNGERFTKGGVPPGLVADGYRDVWIGDKDRKKGEWIRPQVATQFEPLFLLTRTGSFVSDVLGVVGRHAVLQTAQGRAASDQRAAKQLAGVRQADLQTVQSQASTLTRVPELAARVEALAASYAALDAQRQVAGRIRALLTARKRYQPVVDARLPDPHPLALYVVEESLVKLRQGQAAARTRAGLVGVAVAAVPDAVEVPLHLGHAVHAARPRVAVRTVLAALVARTLPAPRAEPYLKTAEASYVLASTLGRTCTRKREALDMYFRCQSAVKASTVEAEMAEAALQSAWAELKWCPICERPL